MTGTFLGLQTGSAEVPEHAVLRVEPDMPLTGIEVTLEGEEGDQDVLEETVVRNGQKELPAGSQDAGYLEKNVLCVIDMFDHFGGEYKIHRSVLERERAAVRYSVESGIGEMQSRCFEGRCGDIEARVVVWKVIGQLPWEARGQESGPESRLAGVRAVFGALRRAAAQT